MTPRADTQKPVEPAAERLELFTVPIVDVKPADDNVRRSLGDLTELTASIKAVGILEPLIVIGLPESNGYQVVAGHRRLAAAFEAGLDYVPVIVRTFSETERVEAMVIENLQRFDLSPTEEGDAFRRLVEIGLSQREIATRVGRSQSHIAKRLALLELPDAARKELDAGGIKIEDALELTKLKDHPDELAKILADHKEWPDDDLAWTVKRKLEDIERNKQMLAARTELEAAGVRIVADKYEFKRLSRTHCNGIDLTPAKHRHEPCHAAVIASDSPGSKYGPRYVCTDPRRHTKGGASKLKVKGLEVRAGSNTEQQDLQRKLQEGRKARAAFVPALIQKRIAKDDVLAFAADQLMAQLGADAGKFAAGWLGITLRKGSSAHDYLRAVKKLLVELKNPTKVLLICSLAIGEGHIGTWHDGSEGQRYRAFLAAQGFKGGSK